MTPEEKKAKNKEYNNRYVAKNPERRKEQKRRAAKKWRTKNKAKHQASVKACDARRKEKDPELFAAKARLGNEKARRKKGMKRRGEHQTPEERKLKRKEAQKAWKLKNPEHAKECAGAATRRYREKKPEETRQRNNVWRAKNPEKIRLKNLRSKCKRRKLLEDQPDIDITKWKETLILFDYKCLYCRDEATSLDHMVPVTRGGTNHHTNCVPACTRCNSSKGKKDLLRWLTTSKIAKEALARPYNWQPEILNP